MKACRRCRVEKPHDSFRSIRNGQGWLGPSARCKECEAAVARDKRAASPHLHRASLYRSNLRVNWGMSVEEFEAKKEAQGGGCAICGGESPRGRLAVDHNHDTGGVRGLLCASCNTGLGSFKDNPHLLTKAIRYLEEHS